MFLYTLLNMVFASVDKYWVLSVLSWHQSGTLLSDKTGVYVHTLGSCVLSLRSVTFKVYNYIYIIVGATSKQLHR